MPHPQPKASTKVPGPSNSEFTSSRLSHALFEVDDQVGYINDSHQAYEALELLITP